MMRVEVVLMTLAVCVALAAANDNAYSDPLLRSRRYSYDGLLDRYQDGIMRRSMDEYQDFLAQRALNEDFSYAKNARARSLMEPIERRDTAGGEDDIYADVEFKRATVITTVPANTTYCTKGFSVDSNGDSWCIGDANNVKRRAYEVDCVFPFQVNGVWYDSCTNLNSANYWCSLDSVYTNRRAYCAQSCSFLARMLSTSHTSCSAAGSGLTSSMPPDSSAISTILSLHNSARSSVSPAATDMPTITWDVGLSRLAQKRAETCQFAHDCAQCRVPVNSRAQSVGQNAYMTSLTNLKPTVMWTNAMNGWNSEVSSWSYGTGATSSTADVGHYTQIVNSGAFRVGCGAAVCSSGTIAYCNYARAQLSAELKKPYTSGTSCSKCGSGNCQNNLCQCTRLCQNGGTLNLATCSCTCPAWTTGSSCETLTCTSGDSYYGCPGSGLSSYCSVASILAKCPFTCKICAYN